MSILCGHCKNHHDSVADVKACASLGNVEPLIQMVDPKPLTALERIKAASAKLPDRERVHYAVKVTETTERTSYDDPAASSHFEFYRVDKPQTGKWKGYTFLKIQASDALYSIRNYDRIANVLEAIANDVTGALAAYGREIGRCGICHRTLTDPTSIELGIGPICREGFAA